MQRRCKQLMIGMLVSLLMIVSPLAAYSQAADADVFGVIKVTDIEGVVSKIGLLVDNVEPGMGTMVNGMVMGQLQMLLQNPQWVGMDKMGEFTVVVMNPMTASSPSPVALLLPLTNEAEFVDVLKQAMTGGEAVEGVMQFGVEGAQQLFFAGSGNVGVLADNAALVAQVKGLVDAGAPALNDLPVVDGQITASIALSKIMTAFAPMIDQYMQMAVAGMSQAAAEDEAAADAAAPMANMMQAEMQTLIGLLQQTEKLELGITVNPDDGVRLMEAVIATPDSAMAKFFAAQVPKISDLLGFLPSDAAVVGSGAFTLTPEFIDGYAAFSKAITMAAAPEDTANAEKMAQYTKDMLLTSDGTFAMAMFSPSQSSIVSAISGLTDPAKYMTMLQEYPEIMQGMLGMYKSMGMEFNVQVSEPEAYKKGEILTMDLGFNADSIPDPEGQEAFKSMFGEQMAVQMGFLGNYAVVGMGKEGRSQVEQLLDAVEAGKRGATAMSPASFGLPQENNFFMGISMPKIMQWAMANVPDAPQIEVIDGPGIGMSANFSESYLMSEFVVPLAEILAIKDVITKVQAAEAAAAPEAAPEATPETKPVQ